jgi:hypothetical protein
VEAFGGREVCEWATLAAALGDGDERLKVPLDGRKIDVRGERQEPTRIQLYRGRQVTCPPREQDDADVDVLATLDPRHYPHDRMGVRRPGRCFVSRRSHAGCLFPDPLLVGVQPVSLADG